MVGTIDDETSANEHPTWAELSQFAAGALDTHQTLWMERHITECETCCHLLEDVPDDRLISLLRESASHRATVEMRLVVGYQILDELGRGGMGVVYRAIQPALNRQVALKMIAQLAPANHQDLVRFRLEAEASAALNHPNIAQVYDVGEIQGQPYIAMELVRGDTLSQLLLQRPLKFNEATGLLIQLTQAIQHAHACGIVHRDLKPSNILLEQNETDNAVETELRPKIVDFGLAKRIDTSTTVTSTGIIVGTPSYMSPELAAGNNKLVGHSTDIYALGTVLYEALVGRPPFKGATPIETLNQVQTAEPAKPSTLRAGFPKDLETICLKCLEKTPSNRYLSATDLLEDLQRFRDGRPIVARPAGIGYRAIKWTKRHPALFALIGVSVLALIGVVTLGLVYNASLRTALNAAENEQRRADENFEFAFQAVERMLERVGFAQLADTPEMEDVREKLLADAVDFYSKLLENQPSTDVESRRQYHGAMSRLGRIQATLGHRQSSLENLQRAIDMQQLLLQEYPHRYDIQHELAISYINKGQASQDASDFLTAIQLLEEISDAIPNCKRELAQALNNLAVVTVSIEEREKLHLHVKRLRQELLRDSPDDSKLQYGLAETQHNLAFLYFTTGRSQAAEPAYRDALHMLERLVKNQNSVTDHHVALAECLTHMASLFHSLGRTDEAITLIERGTETRKLLAARFPKLPSMRQAVIRGLLTQSAFLIQVSRFESAAQLSEQAVEIATDLTEEFSSHEQLFSEATCLTMWATALSGVPKLLESRTAFERANRIYNELLVAEPDNPDFQTEAGVHFMNYSNILRAEDPTLAAEFNDRSVALLERAFDASPQRTDFESYLFNAHGARAGTYDSLGNHREAATSWNRALQLAPHERHFEIGLLRLLSLARGGETALATEAANSMLADEILDGATLYNIACVFGLLDKSNKNTGQSHTPEQLYNSHCERAIELLSRKEAMDFLDNAENYRQMMVDSDLETVRNHPLFSELIERLHPPD